ncbi:MAG: hypothetical protein Q7O66_15715, partial [Dehalococcoidia bacterium]|nr:hypothetical protein [Dehalococcoidia bacterium]
GLTRKELHVNQMEMHGMGVATEVCYLPDLDGIRVRRFRSGIVIGSDKAVWVVQGSLGSISPAAAAAPSLSNCRLSRFICCDPFC